MSECWKKEGEVYRKFGWLWGRLYRERGRLCDGGDLNECISMYLGCLLSVRAFGPSKFLYILKNFGILDFPPIPLPPYLFLLFSATIKKNFFEKSFFSFLFCSPLFVLRNLFFSFFFFFLKQKKNVAIIIYFIWQLNCKLLGTCLLVASPMEGGNLKWLWITYFFFFFGLSKW